VRDRVLVASYLATAKSARSRGVEIEGRWAVLDGLQLDAAVAYDDATYTSFDSAPCGTEWTGIATSCDLTGKPISAAPRWSGDVRGEYVRLLTRNLRGSAGIEYTFRSSSYYTSDDSAYLVDQWLRPGKPARKRRFRLRSLAGLIMGEECFR